MQVLKRETYLKMIENADGARIFNSLFVRRENSDKTEDILNDGELSCAFFVSNLLFIFGWVNAPHTTVKSMREVLLGNEWEDVGVNNIQQGDILFWEEMIFDDGDAHSHIGFALNEAEAISTSEKSRRILRHHITYGTGEDGTPKRKVETAYRRADFL